MGGVDLVWMSYVCLVGMVLYTKGVIHFMAVSRQGLLTALYPCASIDRRAESPLSSGGVIRKHGAY